VSAPRRIVVGITGATGSIYGIRLLEVLRAAGGLELHLVLSQPGKRTLVEETGRSVREVEALADVVARRPRRRGLDRQRLLPHPGHGGGACSVKTMSCLAHGVTDTLIARAGDVTLKEGRPLVLLVRETPLHALHLRSLLALAEAGAVILPPMPAF